MSAHMHTHTHTHTYTLTYSLTYIHICTKYAHTLRAQTHKHTNILGVILTLDQSSVSISEGDSGVNTSASLCLTLRNVLDGLRRDVEISLSTQDRAASK